MYLMMKNLMKIWMLAVIIKVLTQGMQFEITLTMHVFDNCLLYLNIYKYYDGLTNSTKLLISYIICELQVIKLLHTINCNYH